MIFFFFVSMLNFELEFEKEFLYFAPRQCHTFIELIILAVRGIDDTIVAFINFCVYCFCPGKKDLILFMMPWSAKSQCISMNGVNLRAFKFTNTQTFSEYHSFLFLFSFLFFLCILLQWIIQICKTKKCLWII